MKIYALERKETIPVGVETAWDFFSNPNNLSAITPPELDMRVTSGAEERIYPGMIITYEIKLAPFVKSGWVTEITHVDAPGYFVDEQRFGPYGFWHHKHFFSETGRGETEARDLVHYALPFGPLGRAAHGLLVRPKIDFIFDYRSARLRELFGT